ncbi:MAG: foldase protein PrsA [Bacteroidota bacterium]
MRFVAALVVLTICAYAQYENRSSVLPVDTLARVGSSVINSADFLERFELMPWPKKDQPSLNGSVKLEFLRSMVAEKLLSVEAASLGLGNDSESVKLQRNLERLFVRDEYYKQQVIPKITVSDAERREGMQRFPYLVTVQVLAVVSKGDANLLRKKVAQNRNKSTVFDRFKDSLFVPVDTLEIKYGSSEKMIEDAVFTIGKDSLSQPVVTEFGMVMFRLLKWENEPQNIKFSHPDRVHKIENIIRDRHEKVIAQKSFSDVTASQRAEADPLIFYPLADSVIAMLRSDSLNYATNGSYRLPSSAVELLMKKFSAELSKPFITISTGNMTLNDVLVGLGNNNIIFPSLVPEHIRIVLNNNIKTVIQNELLSREGLRQNLNQSTKVRHDLSVWMDSRKNWLLSRMIMDTVTVTEKEIEDEFVSNGLKYGAEMMVKVKAMVVDSVSLSMQILKRLANGESFERLAQVYSRKNIPLFSGEVSDWKNIRSMGIFGQFAAAAALDQIVGPKMIDEGIALFIVVGRKIVDDSVKTQFNSKKNEISYNLLSKKQQNALNKYIGTLAKKYNVIINEAALKNVRTTTTNMVTWRNIGFGGRMVAVPQMFKQAEWVDEWKNQNQVNQ